MECGRVEILVQKWEWPALYASLSLSLRYYNCAGRKVYTCTLWNILSIHPGRMNIPWYIGSGTLCVRAVSTTLKRKAQPQSTATSASSLSILFFLLSVEINHLRIFPFMNERALSPVPAYFFAYDTHECYIEYAINLIAGLKNTISQSISWDTTRVLMQLR